MSKEAMKMALEALESDPKSFAWLISKKQAITALRQALETEQKTAVSPDGGTGFIDGVWHEPGPTAWRCQCGKPYTVTCISSKPSKREWVGLTADEIWKCNKAKSGSAVEFHICYAHQNVLDFAESIEAKLKEKNA